MQKILLLLILCVSTVMLLSCGGNSRTNILKANAKSHKLLYPIGDTIYFGAYPDFGGSEDKVSKKRIKDFETVAAKKIAWACFSQNWYSGIVYPKKAIHDIYESAIVPFVRLMPRSDDRQGRAESKFSLQHIIDGQFDTELKVWAQEAKKDNIPLLVDFAVEMNGNWFPWSGTFNGGGTTDKYGDMTYPDGPERFRDAYRHIIDLFRAEGVKHITWFFHPDHTSYPKKDWNQPKYYYPGDDYIDWIGFSMYGAQEVNEEWDGLAFSTQLEAQSSTIKALKSTKPIALLEFGVTEHPDGNKSQWLEDAFMTILNNPYLKFSAISPWHENWKNKDGTTSILRFDSSSDSLSTFRKWVSDERFVSELRFN
jgi:beta-mannanase